MTMCILSILFGCLSVTVFFIALTLKRYVNQYNITVAKMSKILTELTEFYCESKSHKHAIVEVSDGATFPYKAHEGDASYDICVNKDVYLKQGLQVLPTGIRIDLPKRYHAFIMPTSGNSSKGMNARCTDNEGNIISCRVNGHVKIGTIDSPYTGELGVTFDCYDNVDGVFIAKGTKVAQMWISKEANIYLTSGKVTKDTNRGANGFGSTDKTV